jgi:tellurite resistance protein TerC
VGIFFVFALDLGLLNRKAHTLTLKEAAGWSILWVTLALAFGAGVWYFRGRESGIQFLSGYLIELSLSVDNVFLFCVIFTYFKIPPQYQHRVLYWGIISAVIMRGIMIYAGAALLKQFHWLEYVFGAFLLYTGWKMFRSRHDDPDVGNSAILRWLRGRFPITQELHGQNFFVVLNGVRHATPLLLVLALVEITDVMFALDSIPAIFGITQDSFIVFTSNILAILGLRSMYFLLSGVIGMFHYLSVGLAFILGFVGVKMLLGIWHIDIPIENSLGVIIGILTVAIIASIVKARRERALQPSDLIEP